jgi:uncharacterized membrane protein required for colicin V production
MVSLQIMFWAFVLFFTVVGYLRGWQREVLALTGLVASLAALSQFGYEMVTALSTILGGTDPLELVDYFALRRQQFWVQAIFHSSIAFFSYQVVARLANQALGGRLGERVRANLERKIVGAMIGALNGYLFVGGLWGFLEHELTQTGYVRLPEGVPYAFSTDVVARPIGEASAFIVNYLPVGIISPTWWLIIFFLAFFVVIIALI